LSFGRAASGLGGLISPWTRERLRAGPKGGAAPNWLHLQVLLSGLPEVEQYAAAPCPARGPIARKYLVRFKAPLVRRKSLPSRFQTAGCACGSGGVELAVGPANKRASSDGRLEKPRERPSGPAPGLMSVRGRRGTIESRHGQTPSVTVITTRIWQPQSTAFMYRHRRAAGQNRLPHTVKRAGCGCELFSCHARNAGESRELTVLSDESKRALFLRLAGLAAIRTVLRSTGTSEGGQADAP